MTKEGLSRWLPTIIFGGLMLTMVRYCETKRDDAMALRKEANCGVIPRKFGGPDKETELIQATLNRDPMFYKNLCKSQKAEAKARKDEENARMKAQMGQMENELRPLVLAVCSRFDELTFGHDKQIYRHTFKHGMKAVGQSAIMCTEPKQEP